MCAGAVPLILNGRTPVLLASFPVGKTPVTQQNAGNHHGDLAANATEITSRCFLAEAP